MIIHAGQLEPPSPAVPYHAHAAVIHARRAGEPSPRRRRARAREGAHASRKTRRNAAIFIWWARASPGR